MAWRLAKSLETLRAQINKMAPNRDKGWDGTIGDVAHQLRKSDHNPDPDGAVRAMDITHDPAGGVNAGQLAEALRASGDKRISYIIWNQKIWNPSISNAWRPNKGHTKHVHVSVIRGRHDDAAPWNLGTVPLPLPILRRQTNIVATVFDDELGAYGPIDHTKPVVSLPAPFPGKRPLVRVFGPKGSAVGRVEDKGPWYDGTIKRPADLYWETGERPRAETDRKTNKAAIDLNPRMAELVGVDGKDLVSWEFVEDG